MVFEVKKDVEDDAWWTLKKRIAARDLMFVYILIVYVIYTIVYVIYTIVYVPSTWQVRKWGELPLKVFSPCTVKSS